MTPLPVFSSPSSAQDAASLAACAVSYFVRHKCLLDAVSVRLVPGRVLAVIGPNGAGKSTLLRLLAGEIMPGGGVVRLDGKPFCGWQRRERARRVAVLPQQCTLTAALTSLEVALLGRIPHSSNGDNATDLAIAREALAAMDATHLSSRLFPSLSGGEKSRVQAARVLTQIWEPPADGGGRFLLLDEPTAALDYAHQHDLLTRVRQLISERIGVLVILHDLNLAAQYADDILVMMNGRMVAEGAPKNVFQAGLLSEVFGMPLTVFAHPHDHRLMIAPAAQVAGQNYHPQIA
jgi:iron complex transport system ATP-binding protein